MLENMQDPLAVLNRVTREEVLEEILLFRGWTHEKVVRSIALLEEMWKRRKREMDRQMQGPAHL